MRLTADDLLDIPVPPHLRGYELVDGKLVEVSLTSPVHGRVVVAMAARLYAHVERHHVPGRVYADVGYVLGVARDPERMRGPDVSYVTHAHLEARGGEPATGWFRLTPDLAVEVDSPGRKPRIEHQRIQDYLDAGVRLLWVIHTKTRSATIYRHDRSARVLRETDELDGEEVVPGFRLMVSDLFELRT
jgi:Uma2 family endonuclease